MQSSALTEAVTVWKDRSGHEREATGLVVRRLSLRRTQWEACCTPQWYIRFSTYNRGGENLHDAYTIVSVISYHNLVANQMPIMWGTESQGKRRSMWKVAGSNMLSFNGYGADVVGKKPIVINEAHIGMITQDTNKKVSIYMNGESGGEGTPGIVSIHDLNPNPITIGAKQCRERKNVRSLCRSHDFQSSPFRDRTLESYSVLIREI